MRSSMVFAVPQDVTLFAGTLSHQSSKSHSPMGSPRGVAVPCMDRPCSPWLLLPVLCNALRTTACNPMPSNQEETVRGLFCRRRILFQQPAGLVVSGFSSSELFGALKNHSTPNHTDCKPQSVPFLFLLVRNGTHTICARAMIPFSSFCQQGDARIDYILAPASVANHVMKIICKGI
eukprot:1068684-Pelagomonas_calceolata.AAC.4